MNAEIQAILALQHEAYAGPTGSWVQRWVPFACDHQRVRCTHGDEILGRNTRCVCMTCGRALRKRSLPIFCFFSPTREVHPSYLPEVTA